MNKDKENRIDSQKGFERAAKRGVSAGVEFVSKGLIARARESS